MALPYSKRRVLVMGTKPLPIPTGLANEARALGRHIEFVHLSEVSDERIEAMRRMYFVYPRDPNKFDYPEEMQAAFGEPPTRHLDLLPTHVRNQLRYEGYRG
jgi:hypothetical protein